MLWIDLEAENSNANRVILIEVKSFNDSESVSEALANAIGKYIMYRVALNNAAISTPLFLAVPLSAYNSILSENSERASLRKRVSSFWSLTAN